MGKPLAAHLTQQDYRIKLSTRSKSKQTELQLSGFDSFIVDIDQLSPFDPAFFEADTLIINITSKNLDGFKRLIAAIEQSSVKNVLFISSSSVYQNLNRSVNEDEGAENPDSVLYQIENLFRQSECFTTTIIRFSGLVGPGRHPGRFFRGGKEVKQPDAPINLIHLDDCIGLIDSILQQSAWGEVFNGCSDTHPIKREFYPFAAALVGQPAPVFSTAQTCAFKIVSNEKIKQLLGYEFIHPDLMKAYQDSICAE